MDKSTGSSVLLSHFVCLAIAVTILRDNKTYTGTLKIYLWLLLWLEHLNLSFYLGFKQPPAFDEKSKSWSRNCPYVICKFDTKPWLPESASTIVRNLADISWGVGTLGYFTPGNPRGVSKPSLSKYTAAKTITKFY